MNTYNEILRSGVVASLQRQELDQKTVSAALNAAMFSLYYAQGATVTAHEQLDLASAELAEKTLVKQQAVISSNSSNNQLFAATQANQYVKQSVTNNAVCAANVQAAANAILRLAGDLGSVYSMVNAAGPETDIFGQAREARDLINKIAGEAGVASRIAMNASVLAAEVSASTVMDKSISTNGSMTHMLNATNSDYNTVLQTVAAATATVAAVSAKEKIAEGNYAAANADHDSTNTAYSLINKVLNLNLTAVPEKGGENSAIVVHFNLITNPFEVLPVHLPVEPIIVPGGGPVRDYYVVFSKDSRKTTFAIGNAENLLLNNAAKITVKVTTTPGSATVTKTINYREMPDHQGGIYTLQDTDGDEIAPGTPYVAFIIAVFTDDHKKKRNNDDDFLSAPSPVFTLTHILAAVEGPIVINPISADVKGTPDEQLDVPAGFIKTNEIIKKDTYYIAFNVAEVTDHRVDYRCVFLPAAANIPNDNADDKPGVIFNLTLAEQVLAGSYTTAKKFPIRLSYPAKAPDQILRGVDAHSKTEFFCFASIGPETTDTLGNPLVGGSSYYPLVLSFSTAEEGDLSMFTNALTDIKTAKPFIYRVTTH